MLNKKICTSKIQDGGHCHLGFPKIQNFESMPTVRSQYASSCQISSISLKQFQRYGNLTVFKMAAVRHLGFVGRILGPSTMTIWWFLLVVQNLVEINAVFSIIYNFQYFAVWLENAYSRPKVWVLGGLHPKNGEQYQ